MHPLRHIYAAGCGLRHLCVTTQQGKRDAWASASHGQACRGRQACRRRVAGASHLGNDGAARPRGGARIRLHRPCALVLEHQIRASRPCRLPAAQSTSQPYT